MSDIILHIKDAYYFEVPKMLWRSNREAAGEFPDWLVRLDTDYQKFEAKTLINGLAEMEVPQPTLATLEDQWQTWSHAGKGHKHAGWPLDAFLDETNSQLVARATKWAAKNHPEAADPVKSYLAERGGDEPYAWFHDAISTESGVAKWQELKTQIDSEEFISKYNAEEASAKWSQEKLSFYNSSLDGKVLIPQPFATLKNAYEPSSGFAISKYMIIQVVVAILLVVLLRWIAVKIASGQSPKGKLWNAVEGILLFVRNQVVVPAMGEHDADRFLPLLWTFFVFIFGLNLAGMVPWVGSPTASVATTGALALIVFVVGVVMGLRAFGTVGYLKNICPQLGLPWYLSFWVVPLLWVIEFASLFIKHTILAIRLLANMVAGHAVLLGIMGLAIGVHAYGMSTGAWTALAGASALGMTALSVLELFVAFLQAAVFTFLAAMFIGSSMHHH